MKWWNDFSIIWNAFFNDHKINKEVSMKKNIKHFFLLTALAAGTIHFVNRFINMTADIKNILKAENGNFYDWKNGQIYYTKRGSGSPLLLIHDLNPVSSSYEWCKVIRKLKRNILSTHWTYLDVDALQNRT